jgi:hypothetical protein
MLVSLKLENWEIQSLEGFNSQSTTILKFKVWSNSEKIGDEYRWKNNTENGP